jgi:hypothetical protein
VAIHIKVLSNDEAFVNALAETPAESLPAAPPGVSLEIGHPTFVPGAVGSWWEILGAIGVIGFPVGVIGNLVASWIWRAMTRATEEQGLTTLNLAATRKVKLVLHSGDKVVEAEIESSDMDAIRASVETALLHVDQQP